MTNVTSDRGNLIAAHDVVPIEDPFAIMINAPTRNGCLTGAGAMRRLGMLGEMSGPSSLVGLVIIGTGFTADAIRVSDDA